MGVIRLGTATGNVAVFRLVRMSPYSSSFQESMTQKIAAAALRSRQAEPEIAAFPGRGTGTHERRRPERVTRAARTWTNWRPLTDRRFGDDQPGLGGRPVALHERNPKRGAVESLPGRLAFEGRAPLAEVAISPTNRICPGNTVARVLDQGEVPVRQGAVGKRWSMVSKNGSGT